MCYFYSYYVNQTLEKVCENCLSWLLSLLQQNFLLPIFYFINFWYLKMYQLARLTYLVMGHVMLSVL